MYIFLPSHRLAACCALSAMVTVITILTALIWVIHSLAESSFSPLRPPALPLAVKSPYLSTWLQAGSDGGNGGYLAGQWPTHWFGQATGWTGMIRVVSSKTLPN